MIMIVKKMITVTIKRESTRAKIVATTIHNHDNDDKNDKNDNDDNNDNND